jgi:hypothetical protein
MIRPVDREIGVHAAHCCSRHGCKYGTRDRCPVESGAVDQKYPCERCGEENEERQLVVAPLWAVLQDTFRNIARIRANTPGSSLALRSRYVAEGIAYSIALILEDGSGQAKVERTRDRLVRDAIQEAEAWLVARAKARADFWSPPKSGDLAGSAPIDLSSDEDEGYQAFLESLVEQPAEPGHSVRLCPQCPGICEVVVVNPDFESLNQVTVSYRCPSCSHSFNRTEEGSWPST